MDHGGQAGLANGSVCPPRCLVAGSYRESHRMRLAMALGQMVTRREGGNNKAPCHSHPNGDHAASGCRGQIFRRGHRYVSEQEGAI